MSKNERSQRELEDELDDCMREYAMQEEHEDRTREQLADWLARNIEEPGISAVCREIGVPLARDLLAIVRREPMSHYAEVL